MTRGGAPNTARPVTAVRGAGYTSNRGTTANQAYDPLNQSSRMTTTPFAESKAAEQYLISSFYCLKPCNYYHIYQAGEANQNVGGPHFRDGRRIYHCAK